MDEEQKKKELNKFWLTPGIVAFGLIATGFAGIAHAFEFGTPSSLFVSLAAFGGMFYYFFK
ncbi:MULTISPECIES: hypothetical protein [unclassified Lentimonas]|uniref:hypothetical protein n=1 Tax=unclassified Lentimonas TaxID=2630993 RepID=UPI001325E59A|nr:MULTISPECIES: hypothetical protein [unclassified Lentimonas]CAA6691208.1 Unannotated [Lentimonas sp. CC19]CAA6694781.1 Unannotated [Lentimonas sp. CC10]CAA7071587.1 Unannotated [Lentimonas sp. CC11]